MIRWSPKQKLGPASSFWYFASAISVWRGQMVQQVVSGISQAPYQFGEVRWASPVLQNNVMNVAAEG
jgi:hypothetical protein